MLQDDPGEGVSGEFAEGLEWKGWPNSTRHTASSLCHVRGDPEPRCSNTSRAGARPAPAGRRLKTSSTSSAAAISGSPVRAALRSARRDHALPRDAGAASPTEDSTVLGWEVTLRMTAGR